MAVDLAVAAAAASAAASALVDVDHVRVDFGAARILYKIDFTTMLFVSAK